MSSAGSLLSLEVVLDASVWVSIDIPTDSNRSAASAWVNGHLRAGGRFTEPTWLIAEVAAAVSRQVNPQAALAATDLLSRLRRNGTMRFIQMRAALLRDTIELATNYGLRAGDAVYVALAQQLDIPLVSFDKDHLSKAGNIVTVIEP